MNFITGGESFCDSSIFKEEESAQWGGRNRSLKFHGGSDGLDLNAAEAALVKEADRQGLDLDAMLVAAGSHFQSDLIIPAAAPSAQNLSALVADELRSSDR